MNEPNFLAAGDILINTALLAYAAVETDSEGLQLRLGFTAGEDDPHGEIRLAGLEARSVLRWLRARAEFLDAGHDHHQPVRNSGIPARFEAISENSPLGWRFVFPEGRARPERASTASISDEFATTRAFGPDAVGTLADL